MAAVYHRIESSLLDDGSFEIFFHHPWPRTFRLASWRDGLGLFRASRRTWVDASDAMELAVFAAAWRSPSSPTQRRFAQTIPAEALALARIPGAYEHTVLQMLRWHDAAWDLARTAPNLTYLVAAFAYERRLTRADLAALLRCRRVDILSWCTGAPMTAASVRFLEKLVFAKLDESDTKRIPAMLTDAAIVRLFRLFTRVSPAALQAVSGFARDTPPRDAAIFLDAVARDARRGGEDADTRAPEAVRMYRDAVRVAITLGIPEHQARERLPRLRSVAAVRAQHDAWSDAMNAAWRAAARAALPDLPPGPFPAPPLADTEHIVAIRDVDALREEGSAMDHCVASHAHLCARGDRFVYRVLAPTRATLELDMRGGKPNVHQLAGIRNAPVPEETHDAVFAWFRLGRR